MLVNNIFLLTMAVMDNLKNDGVNEVDTYKSLSYQNLFLNYLTMEINYIAEIRQEDLKNDFVTSMNDEIHFDKFTCTNIIPYRIASRFYELNGDTDMSILMANKAEVAMQTKKLESKRIRNIFNDGGDE